MMFDYADFSAAFPWFFPVAAFMIGACVGSFLNVVIYRVPNGKSVVYPGSHCGCGQPIAWHDNIPILSWLLLRGRARCCGRAFAFRYPFVELLTAVLFVACWLKFTPAVAICGWVFLSCLIAATFIDLDHFIIPDAFTTWLAVFGVVLSFAVPALHGQHDGPFLEASVRSGLTAVLGAAIGSALVLWIALVAETVLNKEAMGFGDVKFVGAIGAFCGWQGAVTAMFGGAIVGVVWVSLAWIARKISGKTSAIAPPTEHADEPGAPFELTRWDVAAASAGVLGVVASAALPAFFGYDTDIMGIESVRSGTAALRGLLVGSGVALWIALLLPFISRWEGGVFIAVKFLGAVGAFSHWRGGASGIARGVILALIAGAVSLLVWHLVTRLRAKTAATSTSETSGATPADLDPAPPPLGFGVHVPFGPMLAVAGALYFLLLHSPIDAWFEDIAALL